MKTLQEQLIEDYSSQSGKWIDFYIYSEHNEILVCDTNLEFVNGYFRLSFEDKIIVEDYNDGGTFTIENTTVDGVVNTIRNYLIDKVQSKIDHYNRQLEELQSTVNPIN